MIFYGARGAFDTQGRTARGDGGGRDAI